MLYAVALRVRIVPNKFKMAPRHVLAAWSCNHSVNHRFRIRAAQRPVDRDVAKVGQRIAVRNIIVSINDVMMQFSLGQGFNLPIRPSNRDGQVRKRRHDKTGSVVD